MESIFKLYKKIMIIVIIQSMCHMAPIVKHYLMYLAVYWCFTSISLGHNISGHINKHFLIHVHVQIALGTHLFIPTLIVYHNTGNGILMYIK